jgi:NADPH:quinone reductase-like Zn-dependent oxidoreductase
MTYKSVVVPRTGPPEVLEIVEKGLRPPADGEVRINLWPNGKSFKLYGTSSYFLFDRRPYLEDWATLFKLLEERKIEPVIMQKFPILQAAQANELLESGQVIGNIVLVAPELLSPVEQEQPPEE